jgi:hypothetical protein
MPETTTSIVSFSRFAATHEGRSATPTDRARQLRRYPNFPPRVSK